MESAATSESVLRETTYEFLQHRVKAVLVSHCHLDHVSGLAMVSPDITGPETQKSVWGLDSTIGGLQASVFNNVVGSLCRSQQ